MTKSDKRPRPNIDGLGDIDLGDMLGQRDSPASKAAGTPIQIPLDALREDPQNARRTFDPTTITELATSFREQGIIEPLIVVALSDDLYEIRSGARRYRAAREAGLTTVPAFVVSDLDPVAAIVVNVQREDIHPVELSDAIQTIFSQTTVKPEDLLTRLGKSKTWLKQIRGITRASNDAKTLLRQIPSSDLTLLYEAARLSGTDFNALQTLIAEKRLSRESVASALKATTDQSKPDKSPATPIPVSEDTPAENRKTAKPRFPTLLIESGDRQWILRPDLTADSAESIVGEAVDGSGALETIKLPVTIVASRPGD